MNLKIKNLLVSQCLFFRNLWLWEQRIIGTGWNIVVRHALRSVMRDLQHKYKLREYAIIIRRGGWLCHDLPPLSAPFAKAELVQPPSWSLDNFYYPTSPHTKYNVTVDVEKLENASLRCCCPTTLLVLEGLSEKGTSQSPMMTATQGHARGRRIASWIRFMRSQKT